METYTLAHTGEALDRAVAGAFVTEELTVTANGEYLPPTGIDAFSKVIAAVMGTPYDTGEFVLDADTKGGPGTRIPHGLGATPDFILVWTDDFADLTEENPSPYSTATNIGYIWLNGLTGMLQYVTSTASSEYAVNANLTLGANSHRVGCGTPSSWAYMMQTHYLPDAETISLYTMGANNYWRAGVTYKYYVARAWWRVGGVDDAG